MLCKCICTFFALPAGNRRVYVCAVRNSTVTCTRHCCEHVKQTLAFMVRTRPTAIAANPASLAENKKILTYEVIMKLTMITSVTVQNLTMSQPKHGVELNQTA